MEEKQKKVIQANWLNLIETIKADALVPYFISAFILSPDDEDTISAGKTLKEQNKTFLHMIYKKGPNTFHTLIQALKRENDDHIAALLEDGIKKEVWKICKWGSYKYNRAPVDDRRILLTSPLKLPIGEIDPEVENNEYFAYYRKHLGQEEGWYPHAYRLLDIEEIMGNSSEEGQYLIWYEGTEVFSPYISVNCGGPLTKHFKIQMKKKTGDKKKVFYIDSKDQFQCLEELVEHVKQYGISLD